jgi:hypothetical protein
MRLRALRAGAVDGTPDHQAGDREQGRSADATEAGNDSELAERNAIEGVSALVVNGEVALVRPAGESASAR